jgi:intracellular sulfur oxidation DsrE/DsrF family protein
MVCRISEFKSRDHEKEHKITYEEVSMKTIFKFLLAGVVSVMVAGAAVAEMVEEHKVVIQVSTADARTQELALDNAVNIQKHYGQGEVLVEIVAYGPGLSMLTKNKKNKLATRIASLAKSDMTFSACGTTMEKMAKKSGKKPVLIEGVKIVPTGAARIMWLQEKGYSYIRP